MALVPATAVSGGLRTTLDVIAFAFPFRATLTAISGAFSGAGSGIGLALLHLALLAVVFGGLARLTLVRFAR